MESPGTCVGTAALGRPAKRNSAEVVAAPLLPRSARLDGRGRPSLRGSWQ